MHKTIDKKSKAWRAYRDQSNRCRSRIDRNGNPIEFRLSFQEWLDIWMASGKWHKRGRRKGCYCMSRHNDIGHYEVGNVSIILHSENIIEGNTGKIVTAETRKIQSKMRKGVPKPPRTAEHRKKISEANKGKIMSAEARKAMSKSTRGENNPMTKFTEDDIREIRTLYSTGEYTLTNIAEKYNVTIGNIGHITSRRTWKHVA